MRKMRRNECIGCGYCCEKAMCALGVRVHGASLPECPFLYREKGVYRCLLVSRGYHVGQGEGCCSPLNSRRGGKTR